jgi:hypothetical protein
MITRPTHKSLGEKRRSRHISLGRRLEILDLIRSGRVSRETAAALMEVSIREVARWQSLHAGDYIVSLDERNGRTVKSEELQLLATRRRLFLLLRTVDSELRHLDAQLTAATRSDHTSKRARRTGPRSCADEPG